MKPLKYLLLICLCGCLRQETPPVDSSSYELSNGSNNVEVAVLAAKFNAFEQYLLTYDNPPNNTITSADADKCLSIIANKSKPNNLKEAAIDYLAMFYSDWKPSQIKKLSSYQTILSPDNQSEIIDTMEFQYIDDWNANLCSAYAQAWIRLMNNGTTENRVYAADSASCYAHPKLMKYALDSFGGNIDPPEHQVAQYFSVSYFDYFTSDYVEEEPIRTLKARWSKWWSKSENKKQFLLDWSDSLAGPRKWIKGGPIYAFVFGVSDYPEKWGDIDLAGVAKDMITMSNTFSRMPKIKEIRVYKDYECTMSNFTQAIQHMKDLPEDAWVFYYFSGHGSVDPYGNTYILLSDFDIDQYNKVFINTPSGSQLQTMIYNASYMHNNRIPVVILDSCLSGGMAKTPKGRIKSYNPFVVNNIPVNYFDSITKSGKTYLTACRGNQYSYDTPNGGAFTVNFTQQWLDKNFNISFIKLLKKTGKRLLNEGYPMTPQIYCPKGNEQLTILK